MKRILSFFLTLVMLVSMLPASVFAAHDSTGRPLDLTGDVYLALYIGGNNFPGEPAEHDVSGYLNLNSQLTSPGFTIYADSANGIIKEEILDDVVQGTSGVWGVFSTTGGSRYLDPADGLVNEDGSHNAEAERKIIQTAIDNKKFTLGQGETIDDYTIIWYVIKYQRSDSAWHIDGLITKKTTFAVNYYGNGNTSGAAPTGANDIEADSTYTVLGNTGGLRKVVGRDTYIFNGWNTNSDGTGTHYDAGDVITVTENITLYAEWYLQNKYTLTFITKLDDVETNLTDFHEDGDVTVWARLEGTNREPISDYFQLEKGAAGTYTAQVTENGNYFIYYRTSDGTMHEAHGHQIVIYNQNGRSECLHYSVSYDANAGSDEVAWSAGSAPAQVNYHATSAVIDSKNIPSRLGYTFLYWKDQDGKIIYPGDTVTESINKKTVLTAQWEENIDVTVNVTINHNGGGGTDRDDTTMHQLLFQLLRQENGVNLPLTETLLTQYHISHHYDEVNHITTYSVTFSNMSQGIYNASATKSSYETAITRRGEANEDQTIDITLTYAPGNFDLAFDVVVNYDDHEEMDLMPTAVNVKVLYWGFKDGVLGWYTITQQENGNAPVTVTIDPATGKGTGYYPVWCYWPNNEPYIYRVEVTSFVMPDGRVIPATGDLVTYKPNGSGLYTAVVTTEPDFTGQIPNYPADSNTTLDGAYFENNAQVGVPTVTIDITTYKVTFVAGNGTIAGQQTLVRGDQYMYPDLRNFVATPNDANDYFTGWYDENGNPATNQYGEYLTGDVTYYARYSVPMSVEGDITVEGTYEQDGETVNIKRVDLPEEVMVVLQKEINGIFVDYTSMIVPVNYGIALGSDGAGSYRFSNLPNDGSVYRIKVLTHNFDSTYDNESDADNFFSEDEYLAILGDDTTAEVDVYLAFDPEEYEQMMEVDATQIAPSFRPSEALSEVLYRDLGNIHHFDVISQHTVPPYGAPIPLAANGLGSGSYDVWNHHTDGSLYEYQMNITKFYGNVAGVFTPEGTPYNSDTAPFTIEYGPSSRYSAVAGGQARPLKATLVPKQYEIIFDVGADAEVLGMDQYLTDGKNGVDYYSYLHTWSYGDSIMAFPYRDGYVFEGWESNHDGVVVKNDGYITVAAGLSQDVTLTAKWRKLEGTAYTVRHLELNTDIPLHGAVTVEGATVNTTVKAVTKVLEIQGYNYAGAMIGGKLYSLNDEPAMTITNDPTKNVLTIYYLPDGSDGYTEQVESNLKLDKHAILENNGTYTIFLETYTMDNPITTLIKQNTPLDIVMVIDQSGSIIQSGYLDELQAAVDNFIELIADHGRQNAVDHRIAIVGYAGDYDEAPTSTDTSQYPIAGGNTKNWVNTGVFDSNGDFHTYDVVKGFNYTAYTGAVNANGTYYTYSNGEYLLLSYHEQYYHMITEEEARLEVLNGTTVYGYVYDEANIGHFTKLTRNSSGLWLYGDKQLYSSNEFFTYHEDVWTHRRDVERREIHAYGTGANYTCADGHDNLFTRTETKDENPELNIYYDALVPVSVGANGSGGTNPHLLTASSRLGSNGGTYVQYGIKMANQVFEANPLPEDSDRVRIMVMFTDGLPGTGTFSETDANNAIKEAYTTKNTHDAYSYTIGLYPSNGVAATDDVAVYMNAVSSNYPNAQKMGDVMQAAGYEVAKDGAKLDDGDTYYYKYNNTTYYEIKYGRVRVSGSWSQQYCWYYTRSRTNYLISTATSPVVSGGKVGSNTIYTYRPAGYAPTDYSGYYSTTNSVNELKDYFSLVMQEITTKITKEIILHEDTILRDIMGQGLVLTPGTVITAYKVGGTYDKATGTISWATTKKQVAKVQIPYNPADTLFSPETTSIQYYLDDGSTVTKDNVPYISVYNLNAANPTDPNAPNYHPHSVDITGYDFENWYISDEHTEGYKMVVEITRVEARDDVQWGRSTTTNHDRSGLWLPADKNGNRELLLPFNQPTTIFVERAYVLDYGKDFILSEWYFDDEDDKDATPIHVDCDISDGMNWFDPANPNTSNAIGGAYGNTKYGNVRVENGQVVYSPTTMNWQGYDQFYIFGNTWRKTVLAQDANENGNLWNKVTVIPANNIYYEDSFITTEDSTVNGIEGFTFTGAWTDVLGGENPGQNVEIPEHLESAPFGDVHGWTDSLGDDIKFTDGGAHFTDSMGASAQFTFTGTGIDVYTRTNAKSGMVVAVLFQHQEQEDGSITVKQVKSIAMDNLAVSGDYYHIPTVSFDNLVYGTYTLQLVATKASTEEGDRYEYYIDGIRVYNPLGSTTNYAADIIKDAYGLENNAVFTEVRDILLDYGDFNVDMPDNEVHGAVFIDQIKPGQESGDDEAGKGVPTYEIGTFETYGPKNEVYLSAGQAIVLKVDSANTYYVGLKSLTGGAVDAHVSGITQADPTTIHITHTTDMYYRVTPVDGYIVIQNGNTDGALLSITNLRTTNPHNPAPNGGVLGLAPREAVRFMRMFTQRLAEPEETPDVLPQPEDPIVQLTNILFAAVRTWLETV